MPIIRALLHLYISTVWPHTEGCEYRISLRNLLTSLSARSPLACHSSVRTAVLIIQHYTQSHYFHC